MMSGILAYILGREVPLSPVAKADVLSLVEALQPLLLFVMLFIAFCKVNPRDMRPRRWHLWLLLTQSTIFILCILALHYLPTLTPSPHSALTLSLQGGSGVGFYSIHYSLESFMLAMICPTATACAVVTQKLGGNSAATTTYTIIISLAVALIAPLFLPLHTPTLTPSPQFSIFNLQFSIVTKVFPLLIFPLLLAWAVRYSLPRLHAKILRVKDLAFYLWAVALALAIAITCRALAHSHESLAVIESIALSTLVACIFQFTFGWWVGKRYDMRLEAGQAMGQKNTIFIIWLGYTFLCPISATAGGFYSIWHNLINSWQLYKKRHQ